MLNCIIYYVLEMNNKVLRVVCCVYGTRTVIVFTTATGFTSRLSSTLKKRSVDAL